MIELITVMTIVLLLFIVIVTIGESIRKEKEREEKERERLNKELRVVRCKDCKFYNGTGRCQLHTAMIFGNEFFYCAYTKRKESEEE